jgi:hypothetical protein
VLIATLSHFPELKTKLELLRSGRKADLSEDGADALWTQVRMASGSLASNVASSVARCPPNGVVAMVSCVVNFFAFV